MPDDKERMWGMLAHFAPFLVGFIGPLLLMFLDESVVGRPSPFVKHHAKQSLIWSIVVLVVSIPTCGLGMVLLIWSIIAGLAANKGEWYTYPMLGSFVDRK
jgi:hypothetical protein